MRVVCVLTFFRLLTVERSFSFGGHLVALGGSANPYLLFTNKYDIQRVNLKMLSVEKVIVNLSSAMGIDYHYR